MTEMEESFGRLTTQLNACDSELHLCISSIAICDKHKSKTVQHAIHSEVYSEGDISVGLVLL